MKNSNGIHCCSTHSSRRSNSSGIHTVGVFFLTRSVKSPLYAVTPCVHEVVSLGPLRLQNILQNSGYFCVKNAFAAA